MRSIWPMDAVCFQTDAFPCGKTPVTCDIRHQLSSSGRDSDRETSTLSGYFLALSPFFSQKSVPPMTKKLPPTDPSDDRSLPAQARKVLDDVNGLLQLQEFQNRLLRQVRRELTAMIEHHTSSPKTSR